jgi:hypothetical protein
MPPFKIRKLDIICKIKYLVFNIGSKNTHYGIKIISVDCSSIRFFTRLEFGWVVNLQFFTIGKINIFFKYFIKEYIS